VQKEIDEQGLVTRSHEMGAHLGSALLRLAERRRPRTRGARGRGLLQGILVDEPAEVVAAARAKGLLLSLAGSNVVRLVPPLIVTRAEIDEAVAILDDVLGTGR
jgi:4-aminobutyrate aminotransferase-like enzyme